MDKKLHLDDFEQDIEDNFESLHSINNLESEMAQIKEAASQYVKNL